MPDVHVYLIEDEDINKEELFPCSVKNYNIYLENYLECFKDVKGLPLGLSQKSAWDFSIHMGHRNF